MSESEKPSRPPLVLLANDQEWSARSLESILGPNGYAVLRAYTGKQVLELARTAQPDLVIVDLRLPDISGIDVCRSLTADPRVGSATPIIITTSGASEREQRLAAYQAGAWEFASQPLDGEVLLLKIDAFLRGKREVDRLRADSLTDPLTGLYNMRGLVRRAREISAEAQRLHAPIACVAFAPVAETADHLERPLNGHTERVVEHLGAVIRRAGRVSDAIGRLGPTDFAIIAPATGAQGAVRMMERIQEMMDLEPVSLGDEEHKVKIRAGYCAVPDFSESAVDAVEMLLRATTALRYLRTDETGASIKSFEDVPLKSAL
ncbi:MAG TPA: response regulator [Gemmatimonadaceae bacterium]|nr:response regulator [Gemmatimonadaceae bacterium]